MADSVLQRPMFSAPQQTGGIAPTVGIATARSPSQTANELRNMFAPTVSIGGVQKPVQSFQAGGPVVDYSGSFPGTEPIPQEPVGAGVAEGFATENLDPIRALLQRGATSLRNLRPLPQTPISFPQEGEMPPRIPGRMYDLPEPVEVGPAPGMNLPAEPPAAATPTRAAERPKGALELTLEGIKAERAKSAEEKRQNALLALMQAGFAMAAGRSPSALSNIAAGGQAGIAAFAGMEKDRRAEDAALRREQTGLLLERERMRAQEERAPEQIRTYAALGGWDPTKGREGFDEAVRRGIEITKSLEKEPDTMRLIKALGGGDIVRGFEVYKGDESLQAARATVGNMMAPEESRRNAQTYLDARIQQSLQSLQGGQGGRTPPPGSTVIPWNQLPR